jgi:hypothetical protein
MSSNRRVILLEFNELSPTLMDRFIDMGQLPNFKRLREQSQVLITEASERGFELNPWVQWVTVHSGLNYSDHRLIELDEGPLLKQPRIWDVVSQAGKPVWLCGSMNIGYQQPLNGALMPDPWSTKVDASDTLQPFFRFVQQNVLEHSSNRPALGAADYLKFLTFMLSHGLSFGTLIAIIKQLVAERVDKGVRWKRAVLLDKLQFDVFSWYYRKLRPSFATFFSNSTAHFQHYHWREMEPDLFTSRPSPDKLAAHDKTILFGYQEMDTLIGQFLDLADRDTVLVFATAISQQPCLIYEEQGGKVMYRPSEMARLLKFAGVTEPHTATPLMAEVFNIQLHDEQAARSVESKLSAIRLGDHQAILAQRKDTLLTVKCQLHERQPQGVQLKRADGTTASFHELFFELEDVKSGMHHPDGMLWIGVPGMAGRQHENKVPLAAVAPTLLQLLSLPTPAHMVRPISLTTAATAATHSREPVPA